MRKKHLIQWAVCMAVAISIPAFVAMAATQAECEQAWDDSSADDSCKDETISTASNNQCTVNASCARHVGPLQGGTVYWAASYTGSKANVKNLNNCQGELKVGNC